jgi:hypothetical protein
MHSKGVVSGDLTEDPGDDNNMATTTGGTTPKGAGNPSAFSFLRHANHGAAPGHGMSATWRGVPIGGPECPCRVAAMSSSLGYWPSNQ